MAAAWDQAAIQRDCELMGRNPLSRAPLSLCVGSASRHYNGRERRPNRWAKRRQLLGPQAERFRRRRRCFRTADHLLRFERLAFANKLSA